MAETRIYVVKDGKRTRLIRASHPTHAVRHFAKDLIKGIEANVATQDELVHHLGAGAKVEETANGGEGS